MGFFQGASNVRISGGEFNLVKGNYNVYDQSRHHTNVNSGNTTSTRTQDSYNDHSTNYNNVDPRKMPPLQRPGQRDQGRSDPRNIQDYFPPPAPNSMLYPQNLPPGSHTQNHNSLNTNYEDVSNVHNNYSQNYGPRPANAHHGRWNSGGPAYSPQRGNGGFQGGNGAYGPSTSPPHSFSPPTDPHNLGRQPNPPHGGFDIPGFPQTGVPYVNGHRPGPHTSADVRPGEITGFTPEMQRTFSQLMQQVNQQFTQEAYQPAPMGPQPHLREGLVENEDSDSDDSESEEDGEDKRMRDPIANGMANLSLNEELRPAFSRNKSDPQLSQPTETTLSNLAVPRVDPRHAESTQDLPQRLKEPFVVNPPSSHVPPPYEQRAQGPPQPPPSTVPAAFGLPSSALQSGPVFRDIYGDYTKVDSSVNNTNINSLNTYNTLIQDSYNDKSTNVNTDGTAEEQNEVKRTAKKQGRIPRGSRF